MPQLSSPQPRPSARRRKSAATDDAVASSRRFRPTPGPSLAELNFDRSYRRFHLPADELKDYDGRLELWDRATETALQVREPPGPFHELPSQRLATLGERIAQVRGRPFQCFGTMDLVLLDKDGNPDRVMQADQSLYLHPNRANVVGPSAMTVGENHYPDVVLEVDCTTDIRRHKLKLYEAWGFPELWVDVPDSSARPGGVHGTTIHVLEDGAFKTVPASRALPGWSAEDIHRALNEKQLSEATVAVLERIGATLGAREGTGPDDDPLQRSLRQQAREAARKEAYASELERRAAMVRSLMLLRDLDVAANFPLGEPGFAEAAVEDVAKAATLCTDEADFRVRLRRIRKSSTQDGTR